MNREFSKEEYEAAHTILAFCRVFVDQINKCLDNSGLRKRGFNVDLNFDTCKYEDGSVSIGKVELEKDVLSVNTDEWYRTKFTQRHYTDGRGWVIDRDPFAKIGTLPENVQYPADGDVSKGMAEDSVHPYPPDGFWIGADYNRPYVDGGQ